MRVFFTKHAKSRLRERGISETKVREVLENPDTVFPVYDDKVAYRKMIQRKNIEVVCLKVSDKFVVITVYYV